MWLNYLLFLVSVISMAFGRGEREIEAEENLNSKTTKHSNFGYFHISFNQDLFPEAISLW